jgi:predicted nucleotidyltransferase
MMNGDEIIARLRENEAALRLRGVAHAALFGSRARGNHGPERDTDIMIEFDPAVHITVFDYAGLKDYIAALFDGRVDVVNRDGLKPYVKPAATTRPARSILRRMRNARVFVQKNGALRGTVHSPQRRSRNEPTHHGRIAPSAPSVQRKPTDR